MKRRGVSEEVGEAVDRRRTADQFMREIERRGWKHHEVARRWGVHRTRIWQIANDPNRAPYWDDALNGLPHVAPEMPARRAGRPRGKVRKVAVAKPVAPGLKYTGVIVVGDVLELTRYIGEDAQEGDRAIVLAVKREGNVERYYAVFERAGSWWLTAEDITRDYATTGLVRDELFKYQMRSEQDVEADRARGLFKFRW